MCYKYDLNIPFEATVIGKLPKRTRSLTPFALQPPQLYTNPIPVSNALKKDLVQLCNQKAIKTQYHSFYLNVCLLCMPFNV